MFGICIEASHSKGMGHLFRMINFAKYLQEKKQYFIFLINNNEKTKEILKNHSYKYEIVDLNNFSQNWESDLIKKYEIKYWINDRLDTNEKHTENILENLIKLISFDDLGDGAKNCDINICGLIFNKKDLKGKKILKGVDYLILNNQINLYKKNRKNIENILVTLGGSDTYGVTIKVLKLLKKHKIKATIHIGPSFEYKQKLQKELTNNFEVIDFVPSLIEEFSKFDLAITGGGITPFEANASGLPCLIVANETFEIPNAEFLHSMGSSIFLGFHENIDEKIFQDIYKIDLDKMSKYGLIGLNTNAVEKIYREIIDL